MSVNRLENIVAACPMTLSEFYAMQSPKKKKLPQKMSQDNGN